MAEVVWGCFYRLIDIFIKKRYFVDGVAEAAIKRYSENFENK